MMKEYKITIDEILTKEVTVLAKNKQEALDTIERKYNDCDIILESDDFLDTIIRESNDIYLNDIASALYCLIVTIEDYPNGEFESFILNNTFYSLDKIEAIMEQFICDEKDNFKTITNINFDYENHIFIIDDIIHDNHLKIQKIKLKI